MKGQPVRPTTNNIQPQKEEKERKTLYIQESWKIMRKVSELSLALSNIWLAQRYAVG